MELIKRNISCMCVKPDVLDWRHKHSHNCYVNYRFPNKSFEIEYYISEEPRLCERWFDYQSNFKIYNITIQQCVVNWLQKECCAHPLGSNSVEYNFAKYRHEDSQSTGNRQIDIPKGNIIEVIADTGRTLIYRQIPFKELANIPEGYFEQDHPLVKLNKHYLENIIGKEYFKAKEIKRIEIIEKLLTSKIRKK